MILAQIWLSTCSLAIADRLAHVRQRAHHGQGLVEYALIIGVVALAAIVVLGVLSGKIAGVFTAIGNQIQSVPATPTP